ncbi:hypothetical protein J6590_059643 [Homalodisca vitripennis]|nr:hypothetical protein J6590_059643 [Homalodisca vitripennis]
MRDTPFTLNPVSDDCASAAPRPLSSHRAGAAGRHASWTGRSCVARYSILWCADHDSHSEVLPALERLQAKTIGPDSIHSYIFKNVDPINV